MMVSLRLAAVFCFLAVAFKEATCEFGNLDDHPHMRATQKKCRAEVPVSDEAFNLATAKDLDAVANDKDLQCYTKCVFETAQTMDETGKVDLTKFIAGMKPEARDFYGPPMMDCQKMIEHPDRCTKAFKLYQCFKEKHGDKYYFV